MQQARLICIRRIRYLKKPESRPHRHDFFQLCYVLNGKGVFQLGAETQSLLPGHVHFYHPNWVHDVGPYPGCGLETIDLRFVVNDPLLEARLGSAPAFLWANTDPILRLLQAIEQEGSERSDDCWEDAAHAHLYQLLVCLRRHQDKKPAQEADLVQQAITIMTRSLPIGIQISQLCEQLHVNETYFSGLFRASTGMTPKAYLTKLKIQQVQQLLLTTAQPNLAAIARRFGWRDVKHFKSVFKQVTGNSPAQFADKYRGPYHIYGNVESFVLFDADYVMKWTYPDEQKPVRQSGQSG